MSSSKLIVIIGATGNQGGSVANVFLEEPGWTVRALTRNTSSIKSQALAARGAAVVQADIDTPATLLAAFEGANAIFAPGQPLNVWAVQFIGHVDHNVKLPLVAAEEDPGPLVKALIQESAGKNLIGYREWLTTRELASTFTKATGLKAEVVTLPKGHFPPSIPTELKAELEDNMAYWNEFGYEGRDDPTVIHPRDLKSPPSLDTVEDYLEKHDWTKVFIS
ncbi:hypothetical protein BBP40_007542 [Aspergillus hancockii]|nr:hypothetical protein BBP40_007542 [Aspergillus hancockii]